VKQTFYIDDIKILSPSSAIFVYAQADKWDEHMSKSERVRIEVLWDGCWNGAKPDCHDGTGAGAMGKEAEFKVLQVVAPAKVN